MDKHWKMISIQEVRDFAKAYDEKLRAWEDKFNNFVMIQSKFGFPRAQFLYPNAFVVQYTGGFYVVFTEHYGYHIFHDDEDMVYYIDEVACKNIPKVRRIKK